jgi:predicted anti-sigma-YlaC factor YlaD
MRHKKIEMLLSNNIDGKLPEKKKKILESHLRKCSSCSSFAENIQRIHEEAISLQRLELSAVYWEEFTSRIKTEISSPQQDKVNVAPLFLRWKWAWAGAALLFVIVAGLFLYLSRNKTPKEEYIFSFEDSVAKVYQEIGSDLELEELFDSVILASIVETLEDSGWGERPDFYENLILWEDLTEEEMKFLESEIKKDTKL